MIIIFHLFLFLCVSVSVSVFVCECACVYMCVYSELMHCHGIVLRLVIFYGDVTSAFVV